MEPQSGTIISHPVANLQWTRGTETEWAEGITQVCILNICHTVEKKKVGGGSKVKYIAQLLA
jgi:hypothetical protein